jgi:hypothetical protein
MALDSTKVRAAVSGAVSLAPTGTSAPTDAATALPVAWKDLGFVSDAGVTESRSRNSNEVHAWQGGALVRVLITSGSMTFHLVLLESNINTVPLFYGATLTQTATDGSVLIIPTNTGGRQSFVVDVIDGTNLIRTYIPQGEVTDIGDHVYVNSDPIGYDITISAYPDAALNATAKQWQTALHT